MAREGTDLRDRTKEFAVSVIRMFGVRPKSTGAQALSRQVLRPATSVGANYREAVLGTIVKRARQSATREQAQH